MAGILLLTRQRPAAGSEEDVAHNLFPLSPTAMWTEVETRTAGKRWPLKYTFFLIALPISLAMWWGGFVLVGAIAHAI